MNRVIITSNKQVVGLMCSGTFAKFLFVLKTVRLTENVLEINRISFLFYHLLLNISSELLLRYHQKRL
jgi:hypothetical protein